MGEPVADGMRAVCGPTTVIWAGRPREGPPRKEATRMSGPKGYSATVSPEVRRRRELEARRRTWDSLVAQIESVEEQARLLGLACEARSELDASGYSRRRLRNPSDDDLDSVELFSTSVGLALTAARTSLSSQQARVAIASLSGLQAAIISSGIDSSNLSAHQSRPSEQAVQQEVAALGKDKADKLIALLGQAGDERGELLQRTRRTLSNAATTERDWLALTADVTSAVRMNSERIELARRADELRALVARLDNHYVVDDLLARIDNSASLAVLESRRPEILDAIRAEERTSERRFIVEQAVEVWRELGYETGTDIHEVVLRGDPIVLHNSSWPDHGLQVRYVPAREQLRTNVVSLADTSAERDREVEEDHCTDVPEFTRTLGGRGISAELVDAKPAGALRVQRHTAATAKQKRRPTSTTKKTMQ